MENNSCNMNNAEDITRHGSLYFALLSFGLALIERMKWGSIIEIF